MDANRIWRSLAAGFCGSAAHSGLMFLKSWVGLLPSFHPYEDLQQMLSHLVGGSVNPWVPWALSFLNGAVVLGILFGRTYRLLPGRSGAAKGFVFGAFGWIMMGVLFFPMLDRGFFATRVGLGVLPCPLLTLDAADLQHHHGHCLFCAVSEEKRRGTLTGIKC
jgi:hypothetical protein